VEKKLAKKTKTILALLQELEKGKRKNPRAALCSRNKKILRSELKSKLMEPNQRISANGASGLKVLTREGVQKNTGGNFSTQSRVARLPRVKMSKQHRKSRKRCEARRAQENPWISRFLGNIVATALYPHLPGKV